MVTTNQNLTVSQVVSGTLQVTGGITGASAGTKTVTFNNAGAVNVSTTGISDGTTGNVAIAQSGAGTTTVSVASGYTGGTTVSAGTLLVSGGLTATSGIAVSGGALRLGAADVLNHSATLTLSGGTFSTGATTGFSATLGTLDLNTASTITLALGTGVHSLNFADSHLIDWTGSTLTITGWTGTAGASGTAGKIFFGSNASGLSSGQLSQINFTGYSPGATILSTGEIVAVPEPATWALLAFSLTTVMVLRRRQHKA